MQHGSYGVVYKGFNVLTKQTVAIKQIRMNTEDAGIPSTTIREVSLLKELNHPNIISLHEIVFDNDSNIFLVFEFIPMDLHAYIKSFEDGKYMNPMMVKSFLYQINQAILYCHMRSILHRDLKPQNILVDPKKGSIKIADFGLGRAKRFSHTVLTDKVATLWYRAPELLLGANIYGYAIDMWSIGCIFAEISSGDALFKGDSEIDQLFRIFRVLTTPTEENWPGVSSLKCYKTKFPKWTKYCLKENTANIDDVGFDLLQKMLTYSTVTRISAKAAVEHPYFDNIRGQLPSSSSSGYY